MQKFYQLIMLYILEALTLPYNYSISEARFLINRHSQIEILREARLILDDGSEIELGDSQRWYRCVLSPSEDIDSELSKLTANSANFNIETDPGVAKLRQILTILWDEETISNYQNSLNQSITLDFPNSPNP